jgi:hypothetical protein
MMAIINKQNQTLCAIAAFLLKNKRKKRRIKPAFYAFPATWLMHGTRWPDKIERIPGVDFFGVRAIVVLNPKVKK